jgi:hypothetical protein
MEDVMKTLKIVAKPVEAIRPTDVTWEDWVRLGGAIAGMVLAIDGFSS